MSILEISSNWIAGQKPASPQPFEVVNRRACMLGACAIRARGIYKNPRDLNLFLEEIHRHALSASTSMENVVKAEQLLQMWTPARILEMSTPLFDTFAKALPPQIGETLIPGESDPPDEFGSDPEFSTYKSMVVAMESTSKSVELSDVPIESKSTKSRRNRKKSKSEGQ